MKVKDILLRGTIYSGLFLIAAFLALGSAAAAAAGNSTASGNDLSEAPTFMSDTQGAPPFGTSAQLGNFDNSITQVQTGQLQTGGLSGILLPEGLVVTPSLGVQEEFTTSNFGYNGNNQRRPTFVTLIRPGLLVSGQTRTVTAVVNYSPYIQLYDGKAYEDSVQQSLDAAVNIALVPDSVNLALRGYVTQQATSGGVNPGGTVLLGPNNRTTTQSYSIEPSYHHFFIGTGTLDVAYILGITRQNGNEAFLPNTSSPYFNNGNFVSQTETANFLTVPIFLRFDDEPNVSTTEYSSGTGVLSSAHQYFASNTVRYALRQNFLLTGSGGYEDIQYQGLPPVRIRDATWSVGVDITPKANSSFIARYQHVYGFNSPYVTAFFPLTQRTTFSASYTDTLTTPQQRIGANVAGSSLNPFGVPVGTTSGLPVVLANQTLSLQSNLQRDSVLSVSTSTVYARDSVGLTVIHDQQKLVSTSPGLSGFSQSGTSGTINYTHRLTEISNLSAYFNYSRIRSLALSSQGSSSTYAAAVNYTRELSPSLFVNAEYILTNQNVSGFGVSNIQNSVIVGIEKTF